MENERPCSWKIDGRTEVRQESLVAGERGSKFGNRGEGGRMVVMVVVVVKIERGTGNSEERLRRGRKQLSSIGISGNKSYFQ